MKRLRFVWMILTSLASAHLPAAQNPASDSKEKTISTDELKQLLRKQDTFFLDVREPKELEELGTVKGYVNIPITQLESRLSEIPKDKLIVTA